MDVRLRAIDVRLPGRREALFSVTAFDAPVGSRILIEGPSGLGKTTFLHLIAGLFHPFKGTVEIGGIRLSGLGADALARLRRRSIGLVFQKLNVIDHLTAHENAGLAMAPGADPASAMVALKAMRLTSRSQVRAGVLSLGEQQRVAVARVVAQKPEILLVDEPTSSLDDVNAELVARALVEAAGAGTLIAVSHDHRLRPYFDRTISFAELIRA